MPFFTEAMEMLTNELRASNRERASFVGHVQEATHKHLADAQSFLHTVAEEHGAMAENLRDTLATNRHQQAAEVQDLRRKFREDLLAMRKGLQEDLARTRQHRQQNLAEKRSEFQAAQKDLASDLRQASKVWSQLSQTRATTPMRKGHHEEPARPRPERQEVVVEKRSEFHVAPKDLASELRHPAHGRRPASQTRATTAKSGRSRGK